MNLSIERGKAPVGNVFGYWKVLGKSARRNKEGKFRFWICECACGEVKEVDSSCLRGGYTISCGCSRKSTIKSAQASLYSTYKNAAKRRNYVFKLSKKHFITLTEKECFYCGTLPQKEYTNGGILSVACVWNGVDRVDNTIGYIESNCVPCCENCNKAKRMLSLSEFKELITKIYRRICI